jgi:hypothetical protein
MVGEKKLTAEERRNHPKVRGRSGTDEEEEGGTQEEGQFLLLKIEDTIK